MKVNTGHWVIVRSNGSTYVRPNLDNIKRAYGFDKEGLENLGWTFTWHPAVVEETKPKVSNYKKKVK